MTDLVGDHISFGEFAGFAGAATEALLDVTEERGIEINASIVRAVERTHRRLREAATALDNARIKPKARHAISLPALLENFLPGVLRVPQYRGDKIAHLIARLLGCPPRLWLIRLLVVSAAVHDFGAADQHAGINSERPAEQAENDESSDADAAATDRDAHTAAAAEASLVTAAVFDIVATAKIIPTHYEILPKFFTVSSTQIVAINTVSNFAPYHTAYSDIE